MTTLETLEEYKAKHPKLSIPSRYQLTGVACPKCGNEMVQDTLTMLACYPPKKLFLCEHCGRSEYV